MTTKREQRALKARENQLEGQRAWCATNTPYGRVTFEEKAVLQLGEKIAAMADAPPYPTKRQTITCKIRSIKWKDSDYGPQLKMCIVFGDGRAGWGTVPKAIVDQVEEAALPGTVLRLTATFSGAEDDNAFGFFSRPKAALLRV